MLIHTVYFWLKPGTSTAERDRLVADCRELLGAIPSVRKLYAGPPAATEQRGVVDGSFGVGLTVLFDDLAGHDVYQPHPLHEKFIERNKAIWDRVVVYDAEG
jgi:hypothetical protein